MAEKNEQATIKILKGGSGVDYKIKSLQYPINLDSDEFNGHRVMFFINSSASGKFADKRRYEFQSEPPPSDSYSSEFSKGASGIQDTFKVEQVAGITLSPKTKRLSYAISLYVPNDLNAGFSTQWSETDMSANASILAEAVTKISNSENKASFSDIMLGAGKGALSSMAGSVMAGGPNGQAAQKALRLTQGNSKAEQLFNSVDYRTFNFNYQFSPKSEAEAANVMNIVNTFRHHMLPEYADATKFLFIYPSEFDVKYFKVDGGGAKENIFLDKHFTAVLTNCNINYSPLGQFSTFKNGMPTQINLSLTFKELALPTKESFAEPDIGQFKEDYSASGKSILGRK